MAATTTEYGKPMILYSDKASVFRVNNKHATTGLGDTQFARAMRCLNITPLCAETSQAKGRVERAHLTLQDRLVKELRLKGICTIEAANAFAEEYMADYNRRFAKEPLHDFNAYRPLALDDDLDAEFTWREPRRVSKNLTVQYDKMLYLIEDNEYSRRAIGKYIDVWHYPDGHKELRLNGVLLPYSTYDRLSEVEPVAIVDNKRLGHVLDVARQVQRKRDNNRSLSLPCSGDEPSRRRHAPSINKSQRSLNEDDLLETMINVEFYKRKKYISAKLLTYFVEHPLFFIGYSINDENIKAILSDIDEIIAPNNALIPNIYLVSFSPECEGTGSHQKEILIGVGENKSIRIKVIYANDFGWIYDALSSNTPEISVNPKLVRALLARTYTFASQSLVKQELPYDFEMLKNIAEQDNVLAKLYGIAELNNGQALNASYPYTISELAKLLDMGSWHYVHKVLERIHKETGFNIKSSDNNYHVLVKTGKEGVHKYSPAAFELIKKIINGQKYKLKP